MSSALNAVSNISCDRSVVLVTDVILAVLLMCCNLYSSVSSTVSTDDVSWTKSDESRLRQHLVRLKDERSMVKLTIVDLESVHLDPFTCEPRQDAREAQKLDLENAVLMQELMAIKVLVITLRCCSLSWKEMILIV